MKALFVLIFFLSSFLSQAQVKDVTPGRYAPGLSSNTNYVKNPSCFSNNRNITVSGDAAVSKTSSDALQSNGSCTISGSSSGDKVVFDAHAMDPMLRGQNCQVSFTYQGVGTKWKFYVSKGGNPISKEVQLEDTGTDSETEEALSKTVTLPYPCGNLSDESLPTFESTDSTPLTFKVADLKLGKFQTIGGIPTCDGSTGCETHFVADVSSSDAVSNENLDWLNGDCPNATTGRATCDISNLGLSSTPSCGCTQAASGSSDNNCYIISASATEIVIATTENATNTDKAFSLWCDKTGADYAKAKATSPGFSATNADTDWVNFTPTGTWVSNTSYSGKYKLQGSDAIIQITWETTGAPTATPLSLILPSNLTIDTSKLSSANANNTPMPETSGTVYDTSGSVRYPIKAFYSSTDRVVLRTISTSGTYAVESAVEEDVPYTWANGDYGYVTFRVPISGRENSNISIGSIEEVPSVPGVIRPKICYAGFGGASANLGSPTDCSSGTCTEVYDTCGAFSPPSRSATGTYDDATFADGTFASSSMIDCRCKAWGAALSALRECNFFMKSGDSSWSTNSNGGWVSDIFTGNASGTAQDTYIQVRCEGRAP